jgi:hypothetical protein
MEIETVSGKDGDRDGFWNRLRICFQTHETKNQRRWNLPCCRCFLNEEGFWERKIEDWEFFVGSGKEGDNSVRTEMRMRC